MRIVMDNDDGDNAMLLTFPFPEHSAPQLPWGNARGTFVNMSEVS